MPDGGGDQPPGARRRVAEELRRLRLRAGLSTTQLARQLGPGWSQSKVSRIELAQQAAAVPDVRAWAVACGVSPDAVGELTAAAEEALIEARDWRRELAGGFAAKQAAVGELETSARHIRSFQAFVVPGLLQTADYARQVFGVAHPSGGRDLAAAAAARVARQQILYDQDRRFDFVITESVLWWRTGLRETLAAQLGHIAALSTLPNVTVTVIPLDAPAPALYRSFDVFDERLATVETPTRELHVHDADEVAFFVDLFARLAAAGVTDDEARDLLARLRMHQIRAQD
ncbi:MAG: helix-turn-helix domain-containing protein [Egibacteraceae bacterium]